LYIRELYIVTACRWKCTPNNYYYYYDDDDDDDDNDEYYIIYYGKYNIIQVDDFFFK